MLANKEIGKTLKPVGNIGEIKVEIANPFQVVASKLKVVLIEIEGDKVPFFIEWCRELNFLIYKFEEVDTPESARKIGLCRIYALERDLPADLKQDIDPWSHLKGWIITDPNQSFHLMVEKIEPYPQQYMAITHYREKEILIPLNDSFILEIKEQDQMVVMELPEGILDL